MNRKANLTAMLMLAGCLLGPLHSTAQQQRGQTVERKAIQRTALVIGNSNYEQGPLRNPVNDARAMGNTLKALGFDVMLHFDLSLRQMDYAIRDLGEKIRDGGIGLFYFAGHGVQVNGVNYLAPVGASVLREQDIKFELLDIGKVTAEMEAAKNRLNILILDACRNNPFPSAIRSRSAGLAPITAPSGTYIAFATAPGTTAADGDGENGLYTQELLTNLKQPGLRLEDIFIRTRVAVKKKSNDAQVPWENGSLEGVVILNEKGAAEPAVATNNKFPEKGAAEPVVATNNKFPEKGAAEPAVATNKAINNKFPAIRYTGIPLSTLRHEKFITARVDEKGQVSKREAGPAPYYLEDIGNGVKLEMVYIRGGKFQMGSPRSELERGEDEIQHTVWVRNFWMGRYEVTQAQWIAIMGRLPDCLDGGSLDKGDTLPVNCVNWVEVQEFIAKLNELLKLEKGKGYSLPREAEWEYAARAGTTTPFPFGPTIGPEMGNYSWENPYANGPTKPRVTHSLAPVGSYLANPFGLHDMFGNVGEWCEDWFGEYTTAREREQIDPKGPAQGERRARRGCSYSSPARVCRSADRAGIIPNDRPSTFMGFRLVRRQ